MELSNSLFFPFKGHLALILFLQSSSTESFYSEILLHQYDIQMYNIMDTMAAHWVFASGLVNKHLSRQGKQ